MPLLLQKTTILYTALPLTRGFKNKPWCVFVLGGKCFYNGNRCFSRLFHVILHPSMETPWLLVTLEQSRKGI